MRLAPLTLPVCLAALLAAAASGWAQNPYGPQWRRPMPMPNVQWENITKDGVVKQIGAGAVQVLTDDNELWVVWPDNNARFSFSGSAEESFLKTGMLVQFIGNFTKRGQPLDDIAMLTLFTPKDGYQVGVFPEGQVSNTAVDQLFTDAKPESNDKKKPEENTTYRVAGPISSLRGNKLTVTAAGKSIKVDLAEQLKISVDAGDLRFARPGDKVNFQGRYVANQKGQALARQLSITGATPLADEDKKKVPPRTDESKAGDKPAEGEAKAEGEKKAE